MNPDFSFAYCKANEILVKSHHISTFPFSVKDVVEECGFIKCKSYKLALKYNLDVSQFGSKSAVLSKIGERIIIFYDDSKPETHISYSILQEYGHFVLDHDPENYNNEDIYSIYEIETNFFTAQLLMPEQIIRELIKNQCHVDTNFLVSKFGVSGVAANKRMHTLAKTEYEWRSRSEKEFDDIILGRHLSFINGICPKHNYYDFEDEYSKQLERDSWY